MVKFTASGSRRVSFDARSRDAQFEAVGLAGDVTDAGFANNFGINFGR